MNNERINERIKEINVEDFIWLIYLGIIFLSYYSNHFERDYFLNNNLNSKEKYRKLTILIFSILLTVYIYFLKDSLDAIKELSPTDTEKKKNLTYLSFIGSLLIALSGFIFIYIAIVDENVDVEIAFN